MSRRGRPRSERSASATIVPIKLRLYPGVDDDLIAFFDGIPTGLRAAAVKRALREGATTGPPDQQAEDDILDVLDTLLL